MKKRSKWPTVPEVLARADRVESYHDVGEPSTVVLRGQTYAHFPDVGRLRIHTGTVANLLKALHGAAWPRASDAERTVYERPAAL